MSVLPAVCGLEPACSCCYGAAHKYLLLSGVYAGIISGFVKSFLLEPLFCFPADLFAFGLMLQKIASQWVNPARLC